MRVELAIHGRGEVGSLAALLRQVAKVLERGHPHSHSVVKTIDGTSTVLAWESDVEFAQLGEVADIVNLQGRR